MLFISGITFFIGAMVMKYKPPKKINMWYGYRTPLSTSSERAWHLAQKHSTKAMFKYSFIMVFIGLFSGSYIITDQYVVALLLLELVILLPLFTLMMLLSTHNYLKRML